MFVFPCNSHTHASKVEVDFSIPLPHVDSVVIQIKPQGNPWGILTLFSLLSRGTLTPNRWDTAPYRWGVGSILFELQHLQSGDVGRRDIFFILPEFASQFIHYLSLYIPPGHYCQWVGIWWWCALYKLLSHSTVRIYNVLTRTYVMPN